MSRHPSAEMLALHARGDLPCLDSLRLKTHLARCAECEHKLALFQSAHTELKREASAQTLTAFEAIADWDRLEREMLGNIVVGVAAARCIEKVGHKRSRLATFAFAAALASVFIAGWITHIPSAETRELTTKLAHFAGLRRVPRSANFVRATPTGIAVRSDGVTLTILHPPGAVVSVSSKSSVEARYIDEDTGQLTITSVYGQ
jgi:anti-sigma factor RsiW